MTNFFASNLKKIREERGLSQSKLASLAGVNQTTIDRWENKEIAPSIDNVEDLANALNISLPDLLGRDLRFDNATYIKPIVDDNNMIKIPVLGVIKAGIPIEAQQDILEYIEIPKTWLRGGKQFYGLKISGDSMFPKYQENDIVVFEDSRNYDIHSAINKDCAVMVNGNDATFKKVLLNSDGITLIPYNTGSYDIKMYSSDDIINKPIKIIGIAREKRTKV